MHCTEVLLWEIFMYYFNQSLNLVQTCWKYPFVRSKEVKNLPAEVLKSGTQDCWKPLSFHFKSKTLSAFPYNSKILLFLPLLSLCERWRYQAHQIPEKLKKRNGCYFSDLWNAVYIYQSVAPIEQCSKLNLSQWGKRKFVLILSDPWVEMFLIPGVFLLYYNFLHFLDGLLGPYKCHFTPNS